MILIGQPIFIWFGLLAAIFIFPAVAAVYLGRKYKTIARAQWHQKLARIGVIFLFVHATLAVLRVFFSIYL